MIAYNNQDLMEYFRDKPFFSREELFSYFLKFNPDLKAGTFQWRIHYLIQKGILKKLKKGIFSVSEKPKYSPDIDDDFIKLAKIVAIDYNDLDYSIWSTSWLNNYNQHLLGKYLTVIEVEKDLAESVFNSYSNNESLRVLLSPDAATITRYARSTNTIIVKPLISRSPFELVASEKKPNVFYKVPTIEKILVDLFSDKTIYFAVQGRELQHIFENVLRRHSLNMTTLFSYAKRRGKETAIKTYIKKYFSHLVPKELLK